MKPVKLTKKLFRNGSALVLGPLPEDGEAVSWVSNGHWLAHRSIFEEKSAAILDAPPIAIRAALGIDDRAGHRAGERLDVLRLIPKSPGIPADSTPWVHHGRGHVCRLIISSDGNDTLGVFVQADYFDGLGLAEMILRLHPGGFVTASSETGGEILAVVMPVRFEDLPGSTILDATTERGRELIQRREKAGAK